MVLQLNLLGSLSSAMSITKEQWEAYAVGQRIEQEPLFKELAEIGITLRDDDSYCAILEYPVKTIESAIRILLNHASKKLSTVNKEFIYRWLANKNALPKGKFRIEVLDRLFEHYEDKNVEFDRHGLPDMLDVLREDLVFTNAKTSHEVFSAKNRWFISMAIEELIDHRLAGHQKYQERIRLILKDKELRKSGSWLVLAYARLGKADVVQDLIPLLDDYSLLGDTIRALGNIKSKEAIPYLEKYTHYESQYFRDLAKKALRKIK